VGQENVELARAQYERWNARDFEGWVEAFDPEVEYLSVVTASMDGGGRYHGHDGLRQFIREFEDWESFRLEPTEYLEAGPKVAVVMRAIARGRGSGVEVDREIAHVWTFRGGRAIRHESFAGREEALEAIGRARS
jgi:ketosteroid isomerase-like protein